MEDPREALLRMGNTPSLPDNPYDIVPAQPQEKVTKKSRIVELQDSTELPVQTSDALMDATQQDGEEETAEEKKARKAAKKARKAAKRAEADVAMNVIPESPPAEEENGQLHESNLESLQNIESLLREHQQQQEQQQQQEEQGDVDGEAALAAQVLASSALRGKIGTDAEQQNEFAHGARVAMMGFPDHSNIDPMLRGPDDTEEDLQTRLQELHAWQAAQPSNQQQQQLDQGDFTQGAPQVPIMGLQGDLNGIFDQQNANIADLAAAAEQQMTADLVQAESKTKAKGGRKRKSDDDNVESGEKSKKRKRRTSQDDDEEGAENGTTIKRKGKKAKASETQEEEEDVSDSSLPTTGPFIKSEIARIEKIVSLFRENNEMTQKDINDLVQNKSREKSEQRDMFWNDLYAALPNRQHVAIQRTTRRRYHNYTERGVWDKEADERLKQAYHQHPQKWVAIGQELNRMPEDCRDRWRNYLACGDSKRTEDWTQKEELALQMIVHELAKQVRLDAMAAAKTKGLAFKTQEWESQVNFNVVSAKMQHKRSRLQCYQHWRIMQARDEREAEGASKKAAAEEAGETTGTTASGAPKNEWRRRQAVENYSKMTIDDKIKIAHAVSTSETLEENMIPWRLLKKQDPESSWSTMDRKVAFQTMKKFVPRQSTLVDTCTAIIEHLEQWKATGVQPDVPPPEEWAGEGDSAEQGDSAGVGGDGEEIGPGDNNTPRNSARKFPPGPGHGPRDSNGKWKRKSKLSADMVVESDVDDHDADEQQNGGGEAETMADAEESVYRSALSEPGDVDSITGEEVVQQPFGQGGAAVAAMM